MTCELTQKQIDIKFARHAVDCLFGVGEGHRLYKHSFKERDYEKAKSLIDNFTPRGLAEGSFCLAVICQIGTYDWAEELRAYLISSADERYGKVINAVTEKEMCSATSFSNVLELCHNALKYAIDIDGCSVDAAFDLTLENSLNSAAFGCFMTQLFDLDGYAGYCLPQDVGPFWHGIPRSYIWYAYRHFAFEVMAYDITSDSSRSYFKCGLKPGSWRHDSSKPIRCVYIWPRVDSLDDVVEDLNHYQWIYEAKWWDGKVRPSDMEGRAPFEYSDSFCLEDWETALGDDYRFCRMKGYLRVDGEFETNKHWCLYGR